MSKLRYPDLTVVGRTVVDAQTGLIWRTLPTPALALAWAMGAAAEIPRPPRWLREAIL